MTDRLQNLRGMLEASSLEALLITDILNVRYISGFTGSAGVVLATFDSIHLLTDSRYTEQAAEECPGITVSQIQTPWIHAAQGLIKRLNIRKVGFEDHSLNYHDWHALDSATEASLVPAGDPVARLRWVKDDAEISATREAVRIIDLTFEQVMRVLRPGITERDVAIEIDCSIRKYGAEKEGFDSIVASGPRGALPHGKPTGRKISEGEFVVMDFGALWNGYNSDITRTVLLGNPDDKQSSVYNIVLDAQMSAIDAVRPGIAGKEVDAVAREHIAKSGYGEYFGHGLGHGIGLAVHDGPILSKNSEVILEPGMIVTVEPGIYIPGWGGIRIEDDVLITEHGHEVLTKSPKSLD